MKIKIAIFILLVVLIPAGLMAQQSATIYDNLKASGNYNTLVALLDKANIAEVKQMPGPFTIFAPDDAAFSKVPPETLQRIMDDETIARSVAFFHIIPGRYMVQNLPELRECKSLCPTADAQPLRFTKVDSKYLINNANITRPDMVAANGVIQGIDAVLIPPMAPPKVP